MTIETLYCIACHNDIPVSQLDTHKCVLMPGEVESLSNALAEAITRAEVAERERDLARAELAKRKEVVSLTAREVARFEAAEAVCEAFRVGSPDALREAMTAWRALTGPATSEDKPDSEHLGPFARAAWGEKTSEEPRARLVAHVTYPNDGRTHSVVAGPADTYVAKDGTRIPLVALTGEEEPGTSPKPSEACARCGGRRILAPESERITCPACSGTGRAKEPR